MVRFTRSLAWFGILAAGLGIAPAAPADDAPDAREEASAPPVRLIDARVGRTPRGLPRVVFETERPVQFLTVELSQTNGFEVHLLGTDTTPPEVAPFKDAVVSGLTFRSGTQGLVARVLVNGNRRIGQSFSLDSPPRVVLDLLPDPALEPTLATAAPSALPELAPPAKRKPATKPAPAPAKKPEPAPAASRDAHEPLTSSTPGDAALHLDQDDIAAPETTRTIPLPHAKAEHATAPEHAAAPEHGAPAHAAAESAAAREDVPPELVDLLGWLSDLRGTLDSIKEASDSEGRAAARRRLARLLESRGLWDEAEKALLSAARAGRKGGNGFQDSLKVAELRVKRGDAARAMEIVTALSPASALPGDRLRLASVYLAGEKPAEADSLARPAIDELEGAERARARWVVAKSLWDRGDATGALPLVEQVVSDPGTPVDLLPGSLLLEADCLCALERGKEARPLYERAALLPLSPNEASWASLQLGNLARRDGRLEDAIHLYETTRDTWPDTFFASQADWFLRFDERLRALRDTAAGKTRG